MLETILSLFLLAPSNYQSASKYDQVVDSLKRIYQQNPQNAELFELGMSDSGQKIWGLKIGKGTTHNLIVGTHHGNEYGSTALALGAAEEFSRNPLNDQTIYVIPVLNISGYNTQNRYESVSGNSHLDPNRDYPGPCVQTTPFQSKATKALADFLQQNNIVSSATLHTFAPAVLYPWGFSTEDTVTADESLFVNLSRAATLESKYEIGNSKVVLYAADGAFEDYAYWKYGIWSLLFEVGDSHSPNSQDLTKIVQENVPGLRRFFETAPKQRSNQFAFTGKCSPSRHERPHLE